MSEPLLNELGDALLIFPNERARNSALREQLADLIESALLGHLEFLLGILRAKNGQYHHVVALDEGGSEVLAILLTLARFR